MRKCPQDQEQVMGKKMGSVLAVVSLMFNSYETFKGSYQSRQLDKQTCIPGGQPGFKMYVCIKHTLFDDAQVSYQQLEIPRCEKKFEEKRRANFFLLFSPFSVWLFPSACQCFLTLISHAHSANPIPSISLSILEE